MKKMQMVRRSASRAIDGRANIMNLLFLKPSVLIAGSLTFTSCCKTNNIENSYPIASSSANASTPVYVSDALLAIRKQMIDRSIDMSAIRDSARKLQEQVWKERDSKKVNYPVEIKLSDSRTSLQIEPLHPVNIRVFADCIAISLFEDEWIWASLMIGTTNEYVVKPKHYYLIRRQIIPGVWYKEVDHSAL